jgi:hypothetical protein
MLKEYNVGEYRILVDKKVGVCVCVCVCVEYGAGNTHVIQFYHPLSVWIIIHQRH